MTLLVPLQTFNLYINDHQQQQQKMTVIRSPETVNPLQVLFREVRNHTPSLGDPRPPESGLRGGSLVVPGLLLSGLRELGVVLPLPLRAHDLGPGEVKKKFFFGVVRSVT